jgi:hypothetical protein
MLETQLENIRDLRGRGEGKVKNAPYLNTAA